MREGTDLPPLPLALALARRALKSVISSSHLVVLPDEGKPETMTSAMAAMRSEEGNDRSGNLWKNFAKTGVARARVQPFLKAHLRANAEERYAALLDFSTLQ